MDYTIRMREQHGFDIEFVSPGHRWLAEARPTDQNDLEVQVHRLAELPAQLAAGDDVLTNLVGWWHVSSAAPAEALALRIRGLLVFLPARSSRTSFTC